MEGITAVQPWISPTDRLRLPYLAPPDGQGDSSFYDFPEHSGGASTESAASLRAAFPTTPALASFMQSWLFFGLLSAFLRHPINHADFVTDGYINLNQDAAHLHFRVWKERLWKLPYAGKRNAQQATQNMIEYALAKSDVFEEGADALQERHEDFDLVALSVKLLASLLRAVLDDAFSRSSGIWAPWAHAAFANMKGFLYSLRSFNYTPYFADEYIFEMSYAELINHLYGYQAKALPLPPGDFYGGRATRLLLRRLESNGWCPFRARQLCQTYDYITVNNLAGLIRHRPIEETHRTCLDDRRCSANDVPIEPTSIYPSRHDSECGGNCGSVAVRYEGLAKIIEDGGIPVVSVSIDGPLDFKLVRCTPYTTYTAISHVWSDGLGNPNGNALPHCQLVWLRKKVCQTYHSEDSPFYDDATWKSKVRSDFLFALAIAMRPGRPHTSFDRKRIFFWIDTLCIPVRPESQATDESKELRFRAIRQITPIFVGAANTLVLDRGLQGTAGAFPGQVGGDEFAALVLSSKWMQRGWTLEEACLSQSCVVLLMEKPYEMTMALRNLMPNAEGYHSPLERAFIDARRSTVLLLKKALLEYKRHIPVIPVAYKAGRLSRLLRVPMFVWSWNSLVDRSTTRPQDGVLILANLLDFDVYPLRLIRSEERLMSVIQGCDEFPLSLLYNRGPRYTIEGHPELGWIPKHVTGDKLVVGAAIRRISPKRSNNRITFRIERGSGDDKALLILATTSDQCVPREMDAFCVRIPAAQESNGHVRNYVVEVQRTHPLPPEPEGVRNIDRGAPGRFLGSCIVIDLACGTSRKRGFAGRGVFFNIVWRGPAHMALRYEAPLIARTTEQWLCEPGNPLPASSFSMGHVPFRQKLTMSYEASLWERQLLRRPLYTMYPWWAQTVAVVVLMAALLFVLVVLGWLVVTLPDALGIRRTPLPHSFFIIRVAGPILCGLIYSPIRNRLSMFRYVSWLRTFDEPRGEANGGSGIARRWHGQVVYWTGVVRRFSRVAAQAVRDMLPRQGDGRIEDGLYGEIHLDQTPEA